MPKLGVRVYIAAFFDSRPRLQESARQLEDFGHKITSGWIFNEPDEAAYQTSTEDYLLACALRDMREIRSSDLLILDTLDETPRGGREVELGVALANGVPFVVVGPYRNVFHRLAMRHFGGWQSLLEWIKAVRT